MPDFESIQGRAVSLLRRSPKKTASLLADARGNKVPFSVFQPGHQDTALDLTAEFMRIAGPKPGADELDAVLAHAESSLQSYPLELVKYALMVFITHAPGGTQLPIPSLELRDPVKAKQSAEALGAGAKLLAANPTEGDLNWFREDPLANEHHERWHVVYPARGIPDAANHRHNKPRQGELFWYMHQQMLARYEAERLAVNLPATVPFADYRSAPDYGYDPGPDLSQYYSPRVANAGWQDMPGYTIAQQEQVRDHLWAAIDAGTFADPKTGTNVIGANIEASADAGAGFTGPGGGLHNMGHGFFAGIPDPQNPGVMTDTATAIRDPIFFRWHRHIDDAGYRWQEKLNPWDFSADAPPAVIRKDPAGSVNVSPDIIVCNKEDVPGSGAANFDFAAFGASSFGGANWDKDPSTVLPVNKLVTQTLDRDYDYTDAATGAIFQQHIRYLDQKEFVYYLRLQNTRPTATEVTVRIFLVPEAYAEQRRMWIEMDKFHRTLAANEKAVLYRQAAESSVIRKPAAKPPQFLPIRRAGENFSDPVTYCDCGWPYNLLLPKGKAAGMRFRLLVMLTDWAKDHVPATETCGSMSFCGSKQSYPDDRPMGYPFDRPFAPGKNIAATIAAQPNMATRDILISTI